MDEQALRFHFEMAARALCMDGFMALVLGLMPVAKKNLKSPKFQEPCMVIGNKQVAAACRMCDVKFRASSIGDQKRKWFLRVHFNTQRHFALSIRCVLYRILSSKSGIANVSRKKICG